ncbi:DUF4244 domain-containing protein [Microbispora sp. CA-135349]|uniref:DUF4244 domain-containing protein n=1 Tax=Microbispora sp. CA-135349 TaxID=3239953 RepID=UPI003D91758D
MGRRAVVGRRAADGHGSGVAVGRVLVLSALAALPGAALPRRMGAGQQGARYESARLRRVAQTTRAAVRRSSVVLRHSVAGVTRRARELSMRWAVQAATRADAGMSTAEYAVGTIAACGFAALLWKVVTSAEVRSMLAALIQKALKLAA